MADDRDSWGTRRRGQFADSRECEHGHYVPSGFARCPQCVGRAATSTTPSRSETRHACPRGHENPAGVVLCPDCVPEGGLQISGLASGTPSAAFESKSTDANPDSQESGHEGGPLSCPACGREQRQAARFCDRCGAPLGNTDQVATRVPGERVPDDPYLGESYEALMRGPASAPLAAPRRTAPWVVVAIVVALVLASGAAVFALRGPGRTDGVRTVDDRGEPPQDSEQDGGKPDRDSEQPQEQERLDQELRQQRMIEQQRRIDEDRRQRCEDRHAWEDANGLNRTLC